MPYHFLIVDDERLNRSYVRDLISEYLPDAVISEAAAAGPALDLLAAGGIDVLLLDIRMPGMDGFELLKALPDRSFELVFITAYSEHAIAAIREGAADYLLKPIRKTEFRDMLARIAARRPAGGERATAVPDTHPALSRKLAIHHQQGRQFVALNEIVYLKASNSYTTLYLSGGQKITTSRPISKYEEVLQPPHFFRIHKSYIIGLRHLEEYLSRDGGAVLMNDGTRIGISRYRLSAFLELLASPDHTIKP